MRGWYAGAVLVQRGANGRFRSTVGFRKLRITIADSRYELLVCDSEWRLVAPANEWYRLRRGVGSPRTRETYLAMLLPFLGYLAERSWTWAAEPHLIRDYTRRFLVDSGCAIQRSRLDGWLIKAGSRSAYSPNALALFIAAARDFYAVLIEGEVDTVTGEVRRYYPYENPMYSELLLRWKREHLRNLANARAPDRAGIRGETWRESASKPVAFFRIRRDPWNPPIAREAPAVRRLILQAFGDMIQHAELREKVILRLLLETGARLSEVLQMSAGGYRRGRSMLVGVSALLRDKGSLGVENKPVRILPETEALLQRYIRGERGRLDPCGRSKLEELADNDPIFLSRRGTVLTDSGFRARWRGLREQTARRFKEALVRLDDGAPEAVYVRVLLPHLHPHLIRHASVTERFSLIDELYPDDTHKRRTLQDLVESDIGWKSPETKQRYIHSLSAAEALELVNEHWVRRLMERAYKLDTALESETASSARRVHTVGGVYVPEVADTLDWLTALKEPS
jgi:integrase